MLLNDRPRQKRLQYASRITKNPACLAETEVDFYAQTGYKQCTITLAKQAKSQAFLAAKYWLAGIVWRWCLIIL